MKCVPHLGHLAISCGTRERLKGVQGECPKKSKVQLEKIAFSVMNCHGSEQEVYLYRKISNNIYSIVHIASGLLNVNEIMKFPDQIWDAVRIPRLEMERQHKKFENHCLIQL